MKHLRRFNCIVCVCRVFVFAARTGKVIAEFGRLYEQQYTVALFNKVRFDVEGGGTLQPQLLHRKVQNPLWKLCFYSKHQRVIIAVRMSHVAHCFECHTDAAHRLASYVC